MGFFWDCRRIFGQEGSAGVWFHLKSRIWRIRFKFLQAFNLSPVRSIYGVWFERNYGDETFKYYITGKYGEFYWSRVTSINYPFVFLDIGANQGLYTIASQSNRFLVQAYAFEPIPDTAARLGRNVGINGSSRKVVIVDKAVSSTAGRVEIPFDPQHTGSASLAPRNDDYPLDSCEIPIEMVDHLKLNEIVAQRDLPIHCKLDVEGHEETVISELLECEFMSNVVEIFFEVDERWVAPESLCEPLKQAGFEFTKSGGDKHYDVLARRGVALFTGTRSTGG